MANKPNVLNGLTKEQEAAVLQEASRIYNSQEEKDKRVIKQYESTPNYSILERTFNSAKRDDYNAKQNIAQEYNAAKGRQTEKFISDNGITYDMLDSVFGVQSGKPIGMGTSARMKQTTESKNNENYLKSLGADMDYLEKYYKSELNNKALQNVADATKNAPVAMNALSSVGNTLSNASYGLGTGLEWLTGNTTLADDLDFGVQANQAIRGTTKDMIGEDKRVANALYDVGMGVADFGGALALGGGNPLLARGFQTASAVGGSSYDAKQRGLTDSQAMAEGLVGGVAELALSKLPFDELAKTNADDAFIKALFKQGVSEGLEEGGTSLVNAIADSIIAGDNSNFNLKKQEYMAQGLSEEEANKGALLDTLKEVGYEGLIGGLSGATIGGINLGTQKVAGKYANTNNELEPLANAEVISEDGSVAEQAQTVVEPTAEHAQTPLQPLETQQATNTTLENGNALNSQIESNLTEPITTTKTEYNTKKIDGFEDVSKEMNKLIGMYGNEEVKAMHNKVMSLVNEYIATNDTSKFHEAAEIASEIDKQLLGKTYKYKATRKGTKGENARTETTYVPDAYIDTLFSDINNYQSKATQNATANNVVPDLANLDTFNQYAPTGKTRVSQTATNTFTNSNMFKKSKLSKQNLEDFIFDGKADVDIVSENESLQRASDMLDKDYNGTIRKLQSDKQYSGAETDAAMMVLEEKLNNSERTGDYVDAMKWARMVVDKAHKIGQGLQAFAKYSRTATGTVVKTQKVASDVTEKYFKKNPNLKNSMGKLGTALSQIGNETVNEVGKSAKSIEQIRKEVATALLNEPVSIAKQFGSADVEYLSRAIEKGMTAKDLSKMLEQKLATGSFGISDSDIKEIIRLFDEADKYGETSKQAYDLQQKAFAIAAKYIGNSSFMDKWNAWRYLAMLGNPRTHIKNTGGNSSMYVVSGIKNNVAAVLEGLVDKVSGGRIDRTKSILNMASAKDRNLVNSSSKDAYEIYTMLNEGGSKYDMKKEIESNKKVYKNKVLNALSNFNSMALEKEDFFFLKAKYSTSLAGYLKANNLDASIFNSTNEADIEKLNKARDYAIKEAQKATFHEASGMAEVLNNASKRLAQGNVAEKAGSMFIEGVLPFKKTPINVLKQGLRYSPASIVKGITTDMIQLKKGNKTASEVIEDFSTGMTGSAIVALGMFLFENGLLSSAASSDDEERTMDSLIGKQNYALQFPDGSSYTIDWLAPSSLPLFVGAELAKMKQGEDGSILDAFMSIADPIVEMSMLQGIDDTLNSIKNSKDSKIGELIAHTASGYLSQAVPTLLGQVARSVDDTRRNTYTDKTGIEGILGKATNKVLNKIPGVSKESEEYVDEWGRTEENVGGNVLGRLAYNMLSPGYYSKENVTSVDAELMDLARSTGDTSIYPNYTNSSPIDGKGKLSPEDYTKYATEKGQAQYDALDALFNSTTYSNLSDGNKVNVISDIYEFTNAIAKKEALNKNIDSDLNKAMKAFNEKGYDGVAKFYSISELASRKNGTRPNLDDYVNAVNKMNLTEEEKGYYLSVLNSPSSNETKEIARVSNVKMAYGLDGLYDYYTIKSQIDTDKKITAYDVVSQYDLTDEEKGFYLRTLDTSDKDKKRAKLDSIEDAYGLDGLYDWYTINDNTIKDSNAGKIIAIDSMDMTDDEKGYYLSLYFDSLSKDAERILENNGYGALYRYYYNKTEKDRIKLLQSNSF